MTQAACYAREVEIDVVSARSADGTWRVEACNRRTRRFFRRDLFMHQTPIEPGGDTRLVHSFEWKDICNRMLKRGLNVRVL